jgi:hypothetical protein
VTAPGERRLTGMEEDPVFDPHPQTILELLNLDVAGGDLGLQLFIRPIFSIKGFLQDTAI